MKMSTELRIIPSVFGERNEVNYVITSGLPESESSEAFHKSFHVFGMKDTDETSDKLFISHVWEGSLVLSDFLVSNPQLICQKRVVELGSGSSLPSLVVSCFDPKVVVSSDFPDTKLINHIRHLALINNCNNLIVEPFKWGQDPDILFRHTNHERFDLVLLAELLWKDTYPLMRDLLLTVKSCLKPKTGIALFSFAKRLCEEFTEEMIYDFLKLAKEEFCFTVELIEVNEKYMDAMENYPAKVFLYQFKLDE
jgi:predicted nicotinamide N-methyase